MKIAFLRQRQQGLTLMEVLVIIAILGIFAAMFPCSCDNAKSRALRIQCVNNLKEIGIASRVWIGDQGWDYTMQVSTNHGGTRELVSGPIAFRHFQIMSNELNDTPNVLVCPADSDSARFPATTFNVKALPGQVPFTSNSNLSYFVGLDASEVNPRSIMSGDRNITNGAPLKDGLMELADTHPAGWTDIMHNKGGNILLGDGSVQQMSTTGLRTAMTNGILVTNRLLLPILAQ